MRASVAVVGGRGYLGSHIADTLANRGHNVWIVGRQPASNTPGQALPYRPSVPHMEAAIAGAECVIHAASLTTPSISEKNANLELENIRLTLDLITACGKQHVRHVIFSSSGGTLYGETGDVPMAENAPARPGCAYAISKYASEEFLREAALRQELSATVLRISNVYGGRQVTKGDQGFISYAVRRALEGEEICLYGDTIRDYIYIDDVANAFLNAVEMERTGFRLFNVSTGVGTSLSGIVAKLQEIIGRPLKTQTIARRSFDLQKNILANGAAARELGWKPEVELSRGLAEVVHASQRR